MKRCVKAFPLIVLSLLLSADCLAGKWSYDEKTQSGDTCFYIRKAETGELFLALGNGSPESVWDECENNGSRDRALSDFKRNGGSHNREETPEESSRALDIYNICVSGATNNIRSFSEIISKYSGKPEDIFIMRKAHQYGVNSARGPRDCTNYVMGR